MLDPVSCTASASKFDVDDVKKMQGLQVGGEALRSSNMKVLSHVLSLTVIYNFYVITYVELM